jgi:hypothetical protein
MGWQSGDESILSGAGLERFVISARMIRLPFDQDD